MSKHLAKLNKDLLIVDTYINQSNDKYNTSDGLEIWMKHSGYQLFYMASPTDHLINRNQRNKRAKEIKKSQMNVYMYMCAI